MALLLDQSILSSIQSTSDVSLSEEDEKEFRKQFVARAKRLGINPDPDSPLGFFNSRKAFLQLKQRGLEFENQDHLGSIGLKRPGHPTQFGFDITPLNPTGELLINRITGYPATQQDIIQANAARKLLRIEPLDWTRESVLQRERQQLLYELRQSKNKIRK
jgi:hypothetical protein